MKHPMPITITAFDGSSRLLWEGAYCFHDADSLERYLVGCVSESPRISRFEIKGPTSTFHYPVIGRSRP